MTSSKIAFSLLRTFLMLITLFRRVFVYETKVNVSYCLVQGVDFISCTPSIHV